MKYYTVGKNKYPSEMFVKIDFFCPEYNESHIVINSISENLAEIYMLNGMLVNPNEQRVITEGFKHEANFVEMPLERFKRIKAFL